MIIRVTLMNIHELNIMKYRHLLSHLSNTLDIESDTLIEQLHVMLTSPSLYVFVANSLEEPLGSLTLFIEPKLIHHGASVGHIEDLVVHPESRGHGIARRLLEHALQEAKSKNCYKIMLHCSLSLFSFYQKFGFITNDHTVGMRLNLE